MKEPKFKIGDFVVYESLYDPSVKIKGKIDKITKFNSFQEVMFPESDGFLYHFKDITDRTFRSSVLRYSNETLIKEKLGIK